MRPLPVLAALVLMIASARCSPRLEEESKPLRTQRERDSVIGASKLPGARGVRGALGASDSAAVRNARLDSVTNKP